jgi:glycosyltransferase involved in cell wall biosynthesis
VKLCVPRIQQEAGGSGTFLRAWREWLTTRQHEWTEDIEADYDVLFVNAWLTPYQQILKAKKRLPEMRVVHRVDGAGWDYGRTDHADWLQRAVSTLADLTIFQSDYSRYSTRQKYPVIRQDGPTIYNPVDIHHFTPDGESHPDLPETGKLRIVSVIWSPNPRKGAWQIPLLAAANPEFEFVFIGRASFDEMPPNLRRFGTMNHDELAKVLRSCDIFLNLSQNDPCPNIVLEAMASGLPVLYVPSGGVPELVGEAGLPLQNNFRSQVSFLQQHLTAYQQMARQRTEYHFASDTIFAAYWQTIQQTARRPLPSPLEHWKAVSDVKKQWVWDKVQTLRQR